MKTFILILSMLSAPLSAQEKQPQNAAPPETSVQPTSAQTSQTKALPLAQQPQIIIEPTAKSAQPPSTQQLITFTADQLDEYESKILDRAETFYNNRMTHLLWTMGVLMGIGGAIVGVLIPLILEWYRRRSFEKEMSTRLQEFEKYTEGQTEKLKKDLIKQIDDHEEAVSSNLAFIFTEIGGLFLPLKRWEIVITSYLAAIIHSIKGNCANDCLQTIHLKEILEKDETTNTIGLDGLETIDRRIDEIKSLLDNISDNEQRLQVESQIKDLQMVLHAIIIKKRQNSKATPLQDEPKQV